MSKSKERMFVGSSTENLKLAYAIQENFDHECEVTVWNQGIFEPSQMSMDSLLSQLHTFEVAVFVFAPNDITKMRGQLKETVRDNVVFELGLFVGALGRHRCFIVTPRDVEALHLPTDLLGLTPASYDQDRTDGNWNAALGPACNQIRKAFEKAPNAAIGAGLTSSPTHDLTDPEYVAVLQSWVGGRTSKENRRPIYFSEVDRELNLPDGTAKRLLVTAAARYYDVDKQGPFLVLFKDKPQPSWGSRGRLPF